MSTEPTTEMMNEAIAVFDGWERYEDKYGIWFKRDGLIKCLHPKLQELKYHTSWDWLMPVVEKIESIFDSFHGYFGVHISSNSCCIQGTKLDTRPGKEHYAYFNDVVDETKIKATHYAVYQFITWYNNQQKQTNERRND